MVGGAAGALMFDRFTDRARKVMGLARQEASLFNHTAIGTHHILYGLAVIESGISRAVLHDVGMLACQIRVEGAGLLPRGSGGPASLDTLPFTPDSKRSLDRALTEAEAIGHNYVGAEHILMGVVSDPNSFAGLIIQRMGADPSDIKARVLALLGEELEPTPPEDVGLVARLRGVGCNRCEVSIDAAGIASVIVYRDVEDDGSMRPLQTHFLEWLVVQGVTKARVSGMGGVDLVPHGGPKVT